MQRSVSEQGFLVKHVCMSAPFFFSIIAQQRPHMAGSELECGGGRMWLLEKRDDGLRVKVEQGTHHSIPPPVPHN